MNYQEKVVLLQEELNRHGIKHFTSNEVLRGWDVPEQLLFNIIPTLRILESVRNYFSIPIYVLGGYRDPEYNKAVKGAKNSLHLIFNAIDFTVGDRRKLQKIHTFLNKLDEGQLMTFRFLPKFSGNFGIGIYDSFIHLDTRSIFKRKAPARWDKRTGNQTPIT